VPSQPSQPPQPSFTPSTLAGGLVYLSSVRPPDTAGGRIEGDIRQQTRAVLEEANRRLAGHRVSLHDAAAVSVYLRRAEDFAAMNEVYRTFVGDAPGTRTTVVANPVHPDALIEIAVEGLDHGQAWRADLEFDYANAESFYCRTRAAADGTRQQVPAAAADLRLARGHGLENRARTIERLEGDLDPLLGQVALADGGAEIEDHDRGWVGGDEGDLPTHRHRFGRGRSGPCAGHDGQ